VNRLVILLVALAACAPVADEMPGVSSGACVRSFRPTLEAWESSLGRVPSKCAYLDTEYSVQLVSASDIPCDMEPGGIVVGCTVQPGQEIYLLNGRTQSALVDTSVHEWTHALAQCVFGNMDREHLRAWLWAPYGAGSIEIQAQASAVVGPCL
jgi:hypothetical protein